MKQPDTKIKKLRVKNAGLAACRIVRRVSSGIWHGFLKPAGVGLKRGVVYLLALILKGIRLISAGVIRMVTNNSFRVELRAALFIASLVAILEHNQLLESLQQDNLQLALPFLASLPPASPGDPAIASRVKAVFIDDLTYEKRFRQESPLDRNELASSIEQLLQQQPQVLVIDLDLSPGPLANKPDPAAQANTGSSNNQHNWSLAETALYSLLKEAKSKPATEIVLSTPMPVFDPVLAKTKADWMKDMCSHTSRLGPRRIRFGLPDIPVINGVALGYAETPAALAVEVSHAASMKENSQGICAQEDLTRYTRKYAQAEETHEEHSNLLNYRFASSIETHDINEACPAGDCSGANLTGAVVFFGGRYSPADSYTTPVGVLSGAMLHAGSYFSIIQPVKKSNIVFAYLFDILMGCLLGIIIYKLASLYRNERSLGSIAMNLAVQPIFPYFMVVLSGLLLARFNLWLNPAPMIFGMAIHAGLVRIEEPYIEDVADQKILGISELRIKQVIYCAVVLWAWIYLAVEMNLFANWNRELP